MEEQQNVPQKKNNATTIVIIIVAVVVVLGLGGYLISGYLAKMAGQKIAEGLIGSATGGQVKVSDDGATLKLSDGDTTISTGDSASWPADMPADVVKPTFGSVKMASKIASDNAWNVVVGNVSNENFTAYKAALVAKGWVSDVDTNFGFSIASFKKDNWDLTVTYDPSSSGISINILPQAN